MVLGMVDSPLGPTSPDTSFIMVCYAFLHDSPALVSFFAARSLVAHRFRCFVLFVCFFGGDMYPFMGFVLSIWCLLPGKPRACSFCLNLLLRGVDASGFAWNSHLSRSRLSLRPVYALRFVWLLALLPSIPTGQTWKFKIENRL